MLEKSGFFQKILLSFIWAGTIIGLPSNIQAISLDISKPTTDQKIVLPNVPVKGKSDPSTLNIEWKTKLKEGIEGTVFTGSNADGNITVNPFPTKNDSFGENTVKATIKDDIPPELKSASPPNGYTIYTWSSYAVGIVSVNLKDPEDPQWGYSDIDPFSIRLTVDGITYPFAWGFYAKYGIKRDQTVSVNCSITCKDKAGNVMPTYSWKFNIL